LKPIITILRKDNWQSTAANLKHNLNSIDHDRDYKVTIVEYSPEMDRTNEQNAYLHAIFPIIEKHRTDSGLEPFGNDGIKMFFKVMHFGITYINTELGEIQQVQKTSKLGVKKFTKFVEFIRKYTYDNYGEFYVMTPDEWRQSKYYNEY